MSGRIRTEIVSGKCIKPTSPTPPHLKFFKLSLLDQLSPNIHHNFTLFFPSSSAASHGGDDPLSQFSSKSQLLQNSLSQTLTRFYPLGGRLRDAATIDCNDHGAIYIEAHVHSSLHNFLTNPDFDTLQHFLPPFDKQLMEFSSSNCSLLFVRFTWFACGGTALSVSLSHKLADLPAFNALLHYWTATCRGSPPPDVPDLGLGPSRLPPREIPEIIPASVNIRAEKLTTRRFSFPAPNVEELKRRIVTALFGRDNNNNKFQFQPSRVEVVLALIWRCATSARTSKTGSFMPSAMFRALNLRPRMEPPVPSTAIGNFMWPLAVTVEEESESNLHVMVKKMRKRMKEFVEKEKKKLEEEGGLFEMAMEYMREKEEMMKGKEIVVYECWSWSKNEMLEVDYGWGNPVCMSNVDRKMKNTVTLTEGRDGGVEALVTLDEQEMDLFIRHHELLQFSRKGCMRARQVCVVRVIEYGSSALRQWT
ncbi:vinorine synthase-like [Senna tora]|uniref:Vinorine synthase-like n=1 Tax=Senna tora TaxID=362788 RepID=A0A834SU72_9FABA|nr:vinorine synthase-like [Senna tora]